MNSAVLGALALTLACGGSEADDVPRPTIQIDKPAMMEPDRSSRDGGNDEMMSADAAQAPLERDASAMLPDAAPIDPPFRCAPEASNSDFSTGDPEFGASYDAAKRACDERLMFRCNDIVVELDALGCVQGVDSSMSNAPDPMYEACIRGELAGSCSRCEQLDERRFHDSCTLQ